MKLMMKSIALCALLGFAGSAHATVSLIPNGDFSTSGGDSWTFNDGGFAPVISFETTGGNTGGFGKIDATAGNWGGVLVAEGGTGPAPAAGTGIPLATLGLTAGESYTFSWDQIDLAANGNVAGIKIESWAAGSAISDSGDQLVATNPAWTTESYTYTIDSGADAIKVVMVQNTGNGIAGFDNISVDDTPIPPPPFVPDQILNGDFEDPGGANWTTPAEASFPATGGNPDGHAVLDGTGAFAVSYAFGGAEKTFASLGFAPGETMTIQLDMTIVSGSSIGGIRLQGPAGYVEELYPSSVIGNGSTWETYTIDVTVPPTPEQASIGLRPGGGSIVAFDNVSILTVVEAPFAATIDQGTIVSWTAASMSNLYQPQESADGSTWVDLGPAISGNSVTSLYDADGSPNYRVQESTLTVTDDMLNGGFETPQTLDPLCAESWECIDISVEALWLPTRITTDFRSGAASMQIKVQNDETPTPNKSEVIQNILNEGGSITPGNTYDFSFWAKQIIAPGVSYVQQYQLQWLDAGSVAVGTGIPVTAFSGGSGTWTETSVTGLVAPPTAVTALIQISAETGAVAGTTAEGEVLIDDVTLTTSAAGSTSTIAATTAPGVGISFPTEDGESYQVKSSSDAITFGDFGSSITGDGNIWTAFDSVSTGMLYRVVEGN